MNVNMRNFLSSQRSVVNANREIRGVKVLAQHLLHAGNARHELGLFCWRQVGKPLDTTMRNNQGMALSARKNIEKGVPPLTARHGV